MTRRLHRPPPERGDMFTSNARVARLTLVWDGTCRLVLTEHPDSRKVGRVVEVSVATLRHSWEPVEGRVAA